MKSLNPSLTQSLHFALPHRPWVYFFVFLAANVALSYGHVGVQGALWIFLFGLFVPWMVAWFTHPGSSPRLLHQKDWAETVPFWWVGLVLGVALFVRVGQLTFWAQWPVSDSALTAYYSMELSQKWFWGYFLSHAQNPAFFNWGLAFFYKILGPSLFSTRLYSLLISAGVVSLTFWACRPFLSRSLSFFLLMVSATGFWVLYAGEICSHHLLALLWQIVGLGLLGRWVSSRNPGESRKWGLLLGCLTGSGFFIGTAWPVVAFTLLLAVVGRAFHKGGARPNLLAAGIPFLVGTLLFTAAAIHGHYGRHMGALLALSSKDQFGDQWLSYLLSNGTALFWGTLLPGGFGPSWGGMLNPVLASFFFLGLTELKGAVSSPFLKWLALCLAVTLAPGFLASGFEIFRLLPSFPFQALIAGLGFQRLLGALPSARVVGLSFLFFAASTSLDLYHLHLPRKGNEIAPGQNLSKAYAILKNQYAPAGPGYVLSDLTTLTWDQSLALATYSFNAVENRQIHPDQARWVAVLENGDYIPFLSGRFPGIQWHDLGEDSLWRRGHRFLGVIPISSANSQVLTSWCGADLYFKETGSDFLNHLPFEPVESLAGKWMEIPLGNKPDPFLESCRDEKIVFLLPSAYSQQIRSTAHQALEKGYPLSLFKEVAGNGEGARK